MKNLGKDNKKKVETDNQSLIVLCGWGTHLGIDLKFSVNGVEFMFRCSFWKPQSHRIGGFVFNISQKKIKTLPYGFV